MLIDAHVHVFDVMRGYKSKLPITSLKWGKVKNGDTEIQLFPPCFENSNSPVEMLLAYMEWCGVNKALLVQNPFYGYTNDYVAQVVRRWPDKFGALAVVDITKGEEAAAELEELIKSGLFSGLKVEVPSALQFQPELELTDQLLQPVWNKCNQLGIPLMLHIRDGERDFESLVSLQKKYPDTTFIICHLGNPPFEKWREFIKIVAKPNMYVELSGLPFIFKEIEEYPYPTVQEYLKIAKEEIGVEKLLWGSDYPTVLSAYTYQQAINLVRNCQYFTGPEVKMIMGENIIKIFPKLK